MQKIKIISKDFNYETFETFTISTLICEIEIENQRHKITISNNNCQNSFKICEYNNNDVDDDILELFENSDQFDELVEFAEKKESKLQDKFLNDFENEFNLKYNLVFKDNIFFNNYQKQIFKNKDNDYILKINHVSDNAKDVYYNISKDDFEISDNDDNIIIEIQEFFDFDNNKINIFNYSI